MNGFDHTVRIGSAYRNTTLYALQNEQLFR